MSGFLPLIKEALVRTEVFREVAGRDSAVVAQIDFRERVGVLVANMARHVDPVEEVVHGVDAGDAFTAQIRNVRQAERRASAPRANLLLGPVWPQ